MFPWRHCYPISPIQVFGFIFKLHILHCINTHQMDSSLVRYLLHICKVGDTIHHKDTNFFFWVISNSSSEWDCQWQSKHFAKLSVESSHLHTSHDNPFVSGRWEITYGLILAAMGETTPWLILHQLSVNYSFFHHYIM